MDSSHAAIPCRETPGPLGRTLSDTHIVHTIPGRARLRVPVLRYVPHLNEALEELLRAQHGITDVRVNSWCHSVTLNYDSIYWTSDTISAFLQKLELRQIEQYESLRPPRDQVVRRPWAALCPQPSTCWSVAAYFTLVVGIILFVLPMVPGGTPLLLLSTLCFSKAAAFKLEQGVVDIV